MLVAINMVGTQLILIHRGLIQWPPLSRMAEVANLTVV